MKSIDEYNTLIEDILSDKYGLTLKNKNILLNSIKEELKSIKCSFNNCVYSKCLYSNIQVYHIKCEYLDKCFISSMFSSEVISSCPYKKLLSKLK